MIKEALIFDHDGTLVNSIDAVVYCTNLVIQEAGCPAADEDDIRYGMGFPTLERFSYHSAVKDVRKLKSMSDEFYRLMNQDGVDKVTLYPGIKEALDSLAREGFSLGLLTNNQGIFTRRIAAKLKYSYDLEIILGEDNVPAPKPDPRGLWQACAGLGAEPAKCWYIGDGKPDYEVARNAGLKSGLVTWGAHPKEDLLLLKADLYFDQPSEMTEFFIPSGVGP